MQSRVTSAVEEVTIRQREGQGEQANRLWRLEAGSAGERVPRGGWVQVGACREQPAGRERCRREGLRAWMIKASSLPPVGQREPWFGILEDSETPLSHYMKQAGYASL